MKYYITGKRRGLGKALADFYGDDVVENLIECDIFINCKHEGFEQVDHLYKAAALNKRVVNIGSHASDIVRHPEKKSYKYGVEKLALREANKQLYWNGINTTCINFGFFDSESVSHKKKKKMTIKYCVGIVDWVIKQPYRVKEITICP